MSPVPLLAAAGAALLLAGAARAQDAPDLRIAALRAVAAAASPEEEPRGWAAAQLQLGEALWAQAQSSGDLAQADEAIAVWRGVRRPEVRAADPQLYAQVEIRLAGALTGLGQQRRDIALVREAADLARSALTQPAFAQHAPERAAAQATLGDALLLAGQVQLDAAVLADARAAFDAARAAMDENAAPSRDLATAWLRAGVADALIVQITGDTARRAASIGAFRQAEAVFTALGDDQAARSARDNVARLDVVAAPAPDAPPAALAPPPGLRRD